jgi:hypothetical protein
VRFTDLGDGQTRVDVVHRGPELLDALWARNSALYDASWGYVLPLYGAYCVSSEQERRIMRRADA